MGAWLYVCMYACMHACMVGCFFACLLVCLFVDWFVSLFLSYPSIYLFIHLSTYPSIYVHIYTRTYTDLSIRVCILGPQADMHVHICIHIYRYMHIGILYLLGALGQGSEEHGMGCSGFQPFLPCLDAIGE